MKGTLPLGFADALRAKLFVAAFLSTTVISGADGVLYLTNNIGANRSNLILGHRSGTGYTDGDDTHDSPLEDGRVGAAILSKLDAGFFKVDQRSTNSTAPFFLINTFIGTVGSAATNYIRTGFAAGASFQHKPYLTMRLLDTNGISTTNVWDLKAIAATNGTIVLPNVVAGVYDLDSPINSFRIDFAPLTNTPPTAQNSTVTGPNTGMLIGSFPVSDSDGTITNVTILSSPTGFSSVGTNWTYNPAGFVGTNNIPFFAVDNLGAFSTTNTLTLITTNVPVAPSISAQPQGLSVVQGSNATFSVTATGDLPLLYQWRFNGTNIAGATNSSYTRIAVQPEHAGSYSVGVTNGAGSVTSSNALLRVLVLPGISGIGSTNGTVSVSFASVNGLSYTLEFKQSLTDPSWTPILPAQSGTGGIITLTDTNATAVTRFYRVKVG